MLKSWWNHNMVQVTQKKLNGKIKTCRLPEAVRVHWFAKPSKLIFLQGHTNITSVIRRLADHVDENDAIFDHIHGNDTASLTLAIHVRLGRGPFPMDLQTLWGIFVDEDSLVRNGLDTLLTITKLGLICKISRPFQKTAMSEQLDVVANWVQNLKNLRSLMLKSFDELNQPWDLHLESLSSHVDLTSIYLTGKLKNQHLVSEFPQNLVELTLSASGLAEDPMQILDKLPNLQILILMSKSFTGKKMLCSFGGFPKLEVLKFKKLEPLEEWNVEEGALPSLKSLEIDECTYLMVLPDGLRHVRTLRELKVRKLPVLSSRIKDNQGEDWNKIAHGCHVLIED
ncbi:hypothetical protein GH714_006489 [Hevea brasiliensis]|uniref:Disease resistance R13L4/SHOC-2-like LRR domain-containing protein n=1 Tax=Hevea brasiliensis TaxID=3981 RepID=A0A6A6NC66_HEVBR|nr:hypothetical protein GH714_006489 [Hevea brasiliensis]